MPEGTKMPDDLQEMKRYAHTMFKYAAQVAKKEGYQKIVVFLDALNQMDDDGKLYVLSGLVPTILKKGFQHMQIIKKGSHQPYVPIQML